MYWELCVCGEGNGEVFVAVFTLHTFQLREKRYTASLAAWLTHTNMLHASSQDTFTKPGDAVHGLRYGKLYCFDAIIHLVSPTHCRHSHWQPPTRSSALASMIVNL